MLIASRYWLTHLEWLGFIFEVVEPHLNKHEINAFLGLVDNNVHIEIEMK